MSKARPSLPEQLRQLIIDSRLTAYRLGAMAGVDEAVVKRFLLGERDLRLETAGKLCDALGVLPLRVGSKPRSQAPGVHKTKPPPDSSGAASHTLDRDGNTEL